MVRSLFTVVVAHMNIAPMHVLQ